MKVLVLVNGAQHHRPFYSRVGDTLVARGHDVVYAVDSHYTDYLYPEDALRGEVHYFSDYFERHRSTVRLPDELQHENLWLALFPDLDRFTHSAAAYRDTPGYYQQLTACLAAFYWELFERHRFDRVVYESVSNAFSYMASVAAERFGGHYVGFAPSRLPNRIDVSCSHKLDDPRLEPTYRAILDGTLPVSDEVASWVRAYLDDFTNSTPDYMKAHQKIRSNPLERYARRDKLALLKRSLAYQFERPADHEHAFQVADLRQIFVRQFFWEIGRSLRVRKLKSDYFQAPKPGARYFIYPMQFHPESSTSVKAPFFVDELGMVRNVAASLPFDALLYVKDHRHVAAGRQSMEFYDAVRRIPNVVLIDPEVNSKELVRNSLGVIASTSTMAYEAVVLGKPVVLFGRTFYDFHPLCIRLRSFDKLFETLKTIESVRATQEEIVALVTAYRLCSFAGSYNLAANHANDEFVSTVAGIIEDPPMANVVAGLRRVDALPRANSASLQGEG